MLPQRRFEVWDEYGKLRTFYTRADAKRFLIGDMFIKENIPLTRAEQFENLQARVGEALF